MSHLLFDKRDWNFILHDQLNIAQMLEWEAFADFDAEIFQTIIDEGVRFSLERIAPVNEVGDREGCTVVDGAVKVPKAYHPVYKEYVKAGWLGLTHSPEFGGQGVPRIVATPVSESASGACMAFAMYGGLTHAAAHLIENFGNDELKSTYVENMYAGIWSGTMCLTEPSAGSEVGDLRTRARRQDDGTFLIDGQKIFISGGDSDLVDNVIHLVLARIEGDPEGTKGISLFVVPKYHVGADGSVGESNNVSLVGIEHKMGINGSATCQLNFGENGPCVGYLVGEERNGMRYMFQMMNEARIACGEQGVSQANAAYQQALQYARDRNQGKDITSPGGGSVSILRHPDVRRNFMLMKAYAEGTRCLIAQAAFWSDEAKHAPTEEQRVRAQDRLELITPIAKAYSTDKAFKVCELAVQILGGYGFLEDYPIEQYLRDTKITSLYEGTNGIQAMDLLGRKMRMKGGQLFMGYMQDLGAFVAENKENADVAGALKGLKGGMAALSQCAQWLMQTAGQDIELAMQQATPYLEIFGDVMVGHQLTQQAVIAAKKLNEIHGSTQVSAEDRAENEELKYLAGKIDTAVFFAAEVLSLAAGKANALTSGDQSVKQMVF